MNTLRILVAAVAGLLIGGAAAAQSIVLATTMATERTGVFSQLLPAFRQASGIEVRVVALGSEQALDMARRGEADVLLLQDPAAEARFVADGFATRRQELMHSELVLVGPRIDPVRVAGKDAVEALRKIAAANAAFISPGEDSATHALEQRLWSLAGRDTRRGHGHKVCGCDIGLALNVAAGANAYVLTDRASWLRFPNRRELGVLVQGDPRLLQPYGVLLVDPAKHPRVKAAEARRFVDWLTGSAGQAVIAGYKVGGEQVLFPAAGK